MDALAGGEALSGLYREASLVVVPSRYETFGLVLRSPLSDGRRRV